MNEELEKIEKEYEKYYKSLSSKVWDTEKGIYGATPFSYLYDFFKEIWLKGKFLDLGSGDGVVVAIASLFCSATGVEFDKKLHVQSREMKNKLGLDNAHFICGDFFDIDFSEYDFIFINPDNSFSKGLNDKLHKELRGVLLVYNIVHQPDLKKGKKYWLGFVPVTVYTGSRL